MPGSETRCTRCRYEAPAGSRIAEHGCVLDGCPLRRYFPPAGWYALPLELRRRFWVETDYSRTPPSPELAALTGAILPPGAPPSG